MRPRWMGLGAAALAASVAMSAPAAAQPLGADVEGLLSAGSRLSPSLLAATLDTEAAAARASGADALDDPAITDSYSYYKDPGVYSAHGITLSQSFPLWGKRRLRRAAALADVDASRGRARAAQDALAEKIKVAYARYFLAARDIAVNQEVGRLARRMHEAALARYRRAGGDQAAVIEALGEATTARVQAARLQGEQDAAAAQLNALVARPAGAPLAAPVRARPIPAAVPSIDALVARARAGNPSLSASDADIEAARTRKTLAAKAWYPDVTVGGGPLIQTNNRPVGFAATIGLNIPLPWGREAAGAREAEAQLGATQFRYDAARLEIEGALGEAVARLRAARTTEALLRKEAIPQAQAGFRSMLANYAQGSGSLAASITAEHQIHQIELQLLQTQLDEQVELAGIERLIGGDL